MSSTEKLTKFYNKDESETITEGQGNSLDILKRGGPITSIRCF